MASVGTWHQHIYNSSPKQPTPHFVDNILGLRQVAHQPNSPTIASSQRDQPLGKLRHVKEKETKVKRNEQDDLACDSNEREIHGQSKSDIKGRYACLHGLLIGSEICGGVINVDQFSKRFSVCYFYCRLFYSSFQGSKET